VQITEVSMWGVRSAVITMGRRQGRLRFRLFPMIHMGRPEFYREVTRLLGECDLIVAEGADAASSTGLAYRIALKMTRQRGSKGLVHQDIDYGALGVPTVFPENLVAVKRRRYRMLPISWLDVVLLTPVLIVKRMVGGRDYLLKSRLEVDDERYYRTTGLGKWLVHKRDAELLRVLLGIHRRRGDEPIVVAVVYGAGHMPAVVQALANRGYTARSAQWLNVIDV
jgi:hypothetical protein